MDFDADWLERFASRLGGPLPGLAAQLRMAPETRLRHLASDGGWRVPEDARKSAVLLLLYPGKDGLSFPLIERSAYDGVHSRQIALPGGATEPEDVSAVETALREAEEEIGVPRHGVRVLGQLSPLYIPPSNFLVQPVVGWVDAAPVWVPQVTEVASVIETPLGDFVRGHYKGMSKIMRRAGEEWEVPSYLIQGHVVWGATAMMLSELASLLEEGV